MSVHNTKHKMTNRNNANLLAKTLVRRELLILIFFGTTVKHYKLSYQHQLASTYIPKQWMANNQCHGGLNKTREVKHIELNIKRHWNGFQPFFCFAFINIKRSIVKSFVVRQIYIYSICNILSWNIACCLITFQIWNCYNLSSIFTL